MSERTQTNAGKQRLKVAEEQLKQFRYINYSNGKTIA